MPILPETDVATEVCGVTLMSVVDVKKGQDKIKSSLEKLDLLIHNNAVQCLIQAAVHGDTSLMRRLLVECIGDKSGYRQKGLILWMMACSPMELTKDNIKLTGTLEDGTRKPFNIELANAVPFWNMTKEVAVLKPFYRDTLTSRITGASSAFRKAVKNTTPDGKPINPEEAFYEGVHRDKVESYFDAIDAMTSELLASFKDNTQEVRKAQKALRAALGENDPILFQAA